MDEAPRLYLITPPIFEAAAFAPLLEAAVASADVACLLLRTPDGDEPTLKSVARDLAPIAQRSGTAVLASGDPRLAARLNLDGLHVAGPGETLSAALAALKPERIVGVGQLSSRDAAMMAGESGVDYLLFGGPDSRDTHQAVCERVTWWASIFNVPCVGVADDPSLAADIARAGAEFVGLGEGLWTDPDGVAATLKALSIELARLGEAVS